MTLTGRHITAGDLTPVIVNEETTYGTPTGDPTLYGDVAEGGRFTFTDNPNPHLAWRYGSRSFDPTDYVTQQKDASYTASLEVRDIPSWYGIINNATGVMGTQGDPLLPSTTKEICVKTGASAWQGRQYCGCKTNKLTISADAPGGVVKFEEEVMASKSVPVTRNSALALWKSDNSPAVQWMNGITLNGSDIYPQSFSLSISNNLDRIRVPNNGNAITGALLEGRREMEFEADIWMEDLSYVANSINNSSPSGSIVVTLGIDNAVALTLGGLRWISDSHPDLIQDKQRQKLKFRATSLNLSLA